MPMTEAEWLACTDPSPMLEFLGDRASRRKCLLFACACERRLWAQPDCEREKVEAVESFADGAATAERVLAALQDIGIDSVSLESVTDLDPVAWAKYEARDSAEFAANVATGTEESEDDRAWGAAYDAEKAVQAAQVRDIFGNPFRATSGIDGGWLRWNRGAVRRLAEAAYEERQLPSGHLDPARLAVLADALEEAGCTDAELLGHLRGPGPHARGCWVLDLVLGKE
jgi:hypothetical protein